jgi:hypothetical protein
LSEKSSGGKRLVGWDIATSCHYYIGFATLVIRGPVPYPNPLGAVHKCVIHIKELQVVLLVRHNNIDVVGGSETVIHDREETVPVRR